MNKKNINILDTFNKFDFLLKQCFNSIYALKEFDSLIKDNEINKRNNTLRKISRHNDFWIMFEDSLWNTLFINIRAIFDKPDNKETINFLTFIEICKNEKFYEFELKELHNRNSKFLSEIEIKNYFSNKDFCPIEEQDFDNLNKLFLDYEEKIKIIKKLSSKIYAHATYNNLYQRNDFIQDKFKHISILDIEELLNIVSFCNNSILHIYWNGYHTHEKNNLHIKKLKVNSKIAKSLNEIINNTKL